jgi:hypothetical protein
MNNGYFDVERDIKTADKGFICQACLVGKPPREQSPDERYCNPCYQFLSEEALLIGNRAKQCWIPRFDVSCNRQERQQGASKPVTHIHTPTGILSTSKQQGTTVNKKRGRKKKKLPEQDIRQLSSQGYGSKAISTKLKRKGVIVSYKTIQRMLSGQRK